MTKRLLKANAMLVAGLALSIGGYLFAKGCADFAEIWRAHSAQLGALCCNTAMVVCASTLIATAMSLPAALGIVGWLSRRSRIGRVIFALVDLGGALPAITWGLFGFALFCQQHASLRAGTLTLAFMLAPTLIAGFVAALREVDSSLVESATALGLPRGVVILRVLVPASRSGLVATVMTGMGRALGDAAVLYFTAGTAPRLAGAFLEHSGATLAVRVYHLGTEKSGATGEAFAIAAILFVLSLGAQAALATFSNQRKEPT